MGEDTLTLRNTDEGRGNDNSNLVFGWSISTIL